MIYIVKITGGWEGEARASGIEEARYNATKIARAFNERVLFVGKK